MIGAFAWITVIISQLRINAVTKEDRSEMISRVKEAMSTSGAWVLDVKQFSNVSICFNFEFPGRNAARLRDALTSTGLRLTEESDNSISSVSDLIASDGADISGTLQITFVHNEPDMRIKVPAIPG
jgi:hypothetical protein